MSTPVNPQPRSRLPSRPKQHRRRKPVGFALVLLAVGALFIPSVFQFVVGSLLKADAWRRGGSLVFQRLDGSFFAPVTLHRSLWSFETESGPTTRVEVVWMEAQLEWRNLLRNSSARWIQRLSARGVTGKIHMPLEQRRLEGAPGATFGNWKFVSGGGTPSPAAVEAQGVDFIFQGGNDFVRLEGCGFTASEHASGVFHADRVTLKQPWLARTFRAVQGTTSLKDGKSLVLGNVVLEPGVEIRSLSAGIAEIANGRLKLEIDVAVFDGALRVEAGTVRSDRGLVFEAIGDFRQINIARSSTFLGLSEAAGGTISDGNFTFRGSPRSLATATAKLRLAATNFQWETRQWDSLSLGAVLMDRRVQVPQLELRQGKNTLSVSGELTLPDAHQKWWEGDFNGAIKARIDNLTELSALLLPEFKYAAGKVSIDGHVRGRGEDWDGQLLLEGSNLTWRNAPIETAHAAVKIGGKELRVARIELVNGDDYLRGNGVVNLFGPTQYWGELRVAVEDLAVYAAFLQKPVLPEPLAGGAIVDWTGEGSGRGHSGRFAARLRKVRSLGALAQQLHPINAALEGTYAPGSMEFSNFSLSDDDSSFTARVTVGHQALNLAGIRLRKKDQLWLEGDALLPFDVWQQWPNVSLAQLLTDDVVSRVNLKANALDLAQASQLSGWKFPIAGVVHGQLAAEGPISKLKLDGQLTLTKGTVPLGWNGNLLSEVDAQFSFAQSNVQIGKFTAHHAFGDLAIGGAVELSDLRAPVLQLTVRSPFATLPLFRGADPAVSVDTRLDLEVSGPLSAAVVKGRADIVSLALTATPDLTTLWEDYAALAIPPVFSFSAKPWADWRFDIAAAPSEPGGLKNETGGVELELHLGGSAVLPRLSGRVEMSGLDARSGDAWPRDFRTTEPPPLGAGPDTVEPPPLTNVTITFSEAMPRHPSLDVELAGTLHGAPFRARALGPLNHLVRIYDGAPPLTDRAVQQFLAGTLPPPPNGLSLRIFPPITEGVDAAATAEVPIEREDSVSVPATEEAPEGSS